MPVADYWNLVLEDLEKMVKKSNYKAWLENLEFVSTSKHGKQINLSTGSRFGKEYIQARLILELKTSVQKYFPQALQINLVVRAELKGGNKEVKAQQKIQNLSQNLSISQNSQTKKDQKDINFQQNQPIKSEAGKFGNKLKEKIRENNKSELNLETENSENSENSTIKNNSNIKKTNFNLKNSIPNLVQILTNFNNLKTGNSWQYFEEKANFSSNILVKTIIRNNPQNENSKTKFQIKNQENLQKNVQNNIQNEKNFTNFLKPNLPILKVEGENYSNQNQESEKPKTEILKTQKAKSFGINLVKNEIEKVNPEINLEKVNSEIIIKKANFGLNLEKKLESSSGNNFEINLKSKSEIKKTEPKEFAKTNYSENKINQILTIVAGKLDGEKYSKIAKNVVCNLNSMDSENKNETKMRLAKNPESEKKLESLENSENKNVKVSNWNKNSNRKISSFQPFSSIPSKKIVKIDKTNQNLTEDLTKLPEIDNSETDFDQKDWQNKTQFKGNFRDQNSQNTESSAFPSANLNGLNPKYTFENLVIAGHNELAASVAKSILRQLGTLYNPVFIHSKVGLGKTHLLQAIGQKALENEPSLKIKYATCETFFNHYLTSIQKNQSAQFRHYYRNVDLLLLDDIQFINGKNSTQEAFFHTFNELHEQNKQIIISSDKPPELLGLVEDRLISRFKWGMVVDIGDPNMEDRLAILRDKVERSQIKLSENQILLIAQTIASNVRDLEGVLNQIKAKMIFGNSEEISQNELERILKINLSESEVIINKTPEKVLQIVAKIYGTTQNELISKNRDKNISTARQIVMYLWHKNFGLSLPIIGKMLARDHTTILHGTQKIHKEIQTNPEIQIKINEIFKHFG